MARPSETGRPSSDLVTLRVRTLASASHEVEVSRHITVADLKRELVSRTNIPVERQRLIYHGRVLQDGDVLSSHGIDDGHTLHLVERPADAPQPQSQPPTGQPQSQMARLSMNLPGNTVGAMQEVLQELLASFGGEGAVPLGVQVSTTTTTAGGTGSGQGSSMNVTMGSQAASQQGGTPPAPSGHVEEVPHLLASVHNYLQRLENASVPTRMLPIVSLQQQQPGMAHDLAALTEAACAVLGREDVNERVQQQIGAAQRWVQDIRQGGQNPSATQPPAGTPPQGGPPPRSQPYPHLLLLVSVLGHLVKRMDNLLRSRASLSLSNACAQLLSATAVDDSNQEILAGSIRQIASTLNWYGALIVELARIASGLVPALEGNMLPLAVNTASVITPDGAFPSFRLPTLLPRGSQDGLGVLDPTTGRLRSAQLTAANGRRVTRQVTQGQQAVAQGRQQATGNQALGDTIASAVSQMAADMFSTSNRRPAGQGAEANTGNLVQSVRAAFGQGTDGGPPAPRGLTVGSGSSQISVAIGLAAPPSQASSGGSEPRGGAAAEQASGQARSPTPGARQQAAEALGGTQQAGATEGSDSSAANTTESGQDAQRDILGSSQAAAPRTTQPRGLGMSLGRRGPSQPRDQRPAAAAAAPAARDSQAERVPTAAGRPGAGLDIGTVLESMAPLLGGGSNPSQAQTEPGGGLMQVFQSLASNPAVQQMASNPAIQRIVEDVAGDESGPGDLGSIMSRMMPMVGPLVSQLRGGQGTGAPTTSPTEGGRSSEDQSTVRREDIDSANDGEPDNAWEGELSPEDATRWRELIQADEAAQGSLPQQPPFSDAYIAGMDSSKVDSMSLVSESEQKNDGCGGRVSEEG
ncbi:unnamed protein product [Ostreobium quekettii]|uniref:Ubiquitin-like domain-containing protein n=1 Tax=Ostreobium quekettii TaxID=121088 RepID=A0A8S1IMA5_9CHLO|nr:unnamed protein product [Ostreobium quekettii]